MMKNMRRVVGMEVTNHNGSGTDSGNKGMRS